MIRVILSARIVMTSGIGKTVSSAIITLMNMKSEKSRFGIRQTVYLSDYQYAVILLIKPDCTADFRV